MKRPTHFVEHGLAVRLDDVLLISRDTRPYVDPAKPYRIIMRDTEVEMYASEEVAVELFASLRRHRG